MLNQKGLPTIASAEAGVIHLLPLFVIITIAGIIAFLLVSSTAPFGGNIFGYLFGKPSSKAAVSTPVTPTPIGCLSCPVENILVYGSVFYDLNENGVKDSGEIGLENMSLDLNRNGLFILTAYTLADGSYGVSIQVSNLQHTLGVRLPTGVTATLSSFIAFVPNAPINHNFGLIIKGDIDLNRVVNIFDYNILLGNFSKTGAGLLGDIDKNGTVNIFDYNLLVTNFGKSV